MLGTPAERLSRAISVSTAESALAAPFASFGGIDFYPDPVERAAICCSRLIRNHPFPDGNKRIAYECMREMLERADLPWPRPREDAIEIAETINELDAKTLDEAEFVTWVRERVARGQQQRGRPAGEATV
ncbi:MAG TPA: Fic family protein [Solirubrobacterales bacterium]|nr:Fic family protein [Solirubrobacterales bacterium]